MKGRGSKLPVHPLQENPAHALQLLILSIPDSAHFGKQVLVPPRWDTNHRLPTNLVKQIHRKTTSVARKD